MAHVIYEIDGEAHCKPIGPEGVSLPRGPALEEGGWSMPRHIVVADDQAPDGPFRVASWEPFNWEPTVSLESRLKARAAQRRWQLQSGGLTLPGGRRVATDAAAQATVAALLAGFERGTIAGSIAFKTPVGFIDLDHAGMAALDAAMTAHTQCCFSAEQAVVAKIESGVIATLDGVDLAPDWPA